MVGDTDEKRGNSMTQSTFSFIGHESIGVFVKRCLEENGLSYVEDANESDLVVTYFTSSSLLEDAYFDEDGLVKNAAEGALLVDISPCAPSLARELAAVAAVNDLRFVEAPIAVIDSTYPDAFFSPENIVCFVACDDDLKSDANVVAAAFADDVRFTGGNGSAQLAKAMYTVQQAAQIGAAIESDALMRTVGAATGDSFLAAGSAGSDTVDTTLSAIGVGNFDGSYTVEMLMSEVVAAMTAADDVDLILPQLEAIMHLLEILAVIGGAGKAPTALSLVYQDEETAAAHGLDWARAEGLFSEQTLGQEHGHEDADAYGGFADLGDFGYAGGFSGYSDN